MSKRSQWKGPFVSKAVCEQNKIILKRSSQLTSSYLGKIVWCHNGKDLVKIEVTGDVLGFKAGTFAFTRSEFSFKKKKK